MKFCGEIEELRKYRDQRLKYVLVTHLSICDTCKAKAKQVKQPGDMLHHVLKRLLKLI